MNRKERGIARSDIVQSDMCVASGVRESKVPKIIVRRLRLWDVDIRLGLRRMNEVREFDGVLDEEHGNVIADDIPVSLLRIQLYGETAYVAREICRTLAAGDRRKAYERFGFFERPREHIGFGNIAQRFVTFEKAARTEAARVHHAFRNALVVEVKDLFPENGSLPKAPDRGHRHAACSDRRKRPRLAAS